MQYGAQLAVGAWSTHLSLTLRELHSWTSLPLLPLGWKLACDAGGSNRCCHASVAMARQPQLLPLWKRPRPQCARPSIAARHAGS